MNSERRQTIADIKQRLRSLTSLPTGGEETNAFREVMSAWTVFKEVLEDYKEATISIQGDIDDVASEESDYKDSIPESMTEKLEKAETACSELEMASRTVDDFAQKTDRMIDDLNEFFESGASEELEDAHTALDTAAE